MRGSGGPGLNFDIYIEGKEMTMVYVACGHIQERILYIYIMIPDWIP
jgi:hypothetical protein